MTFDFAWRHSSALASRPNEHGRPTSVGLLAKPAAGNQIPLILMLVLLAVPRLDAGTSVSYTVQSGPAGVVFDGTNIWVANNQSNTVTKLLASNGSKVGTYAVEQGPQGLVFDGANVWVANNQSGTVTKILASTGVTVGNYAVGTNPYGLAFDGTNIWVTNNGSNTVTKLLASNGTVEGTYGVGTGPEGVVFDGTNIWVANNGSDNVTQLLASNGNTVNTWAEAAGSGPHGVAFDGANIWVTNVGAANVTEIQASTGNTVGTYTVGTDPVGVLFDGTSIWVANFGSGNVTQFFASAGVAVGTYAAGVNPWNLASDGTNIWATNYSNSTVTKFTPNPAIAPSGVVPIYSTVSTIETGEWVSIYGANLASSTVQWSGNFPTTLGGTSVTIDGNPAYLSYVSPGLINLQVPDDTKTGPVTVVVTTGIASASSTVTLGEFGPSFLLLDSKHVAGIIPRSNGSGAYDGGAYDILGPTGNSLGYPTVAAKAGDVVELYGVGFGPTSPDFPAGQVLPPKEYGTATNTTALIINGQSIPTSFVSFEGITQAGVYQFNVTIPAGLGTGDVPIVGQVGGEQSPSGMVISLQ